MYGSPTANSTPADQQPQIRPVVWYVEETRGLVACRKEDVGVFFVVIFIIVSSHYAGKQRPSNRFSLLYEVEHSNSRFESIRFVVRIDSFCKK